MKPIIIITGPTGSGKTDFSIKLAEAISGEIINADMGQMYMHLTIGTAKPDWRNDTIPHHLFDFLDVPVSYTAAAYRKEVNRIVHDIEQRDKVPIVVGGSGFYIQSLLWNFKEITKKESLLRDDINAASFTNEELWQILQQRDPARAMKIHVNDRYRITRALQIIEQGLIPSELKPIFEPIRPFVIINIMRDTKDLEERIALRLDIMLRGGWIEEVAQLTSEWKSFVHEKKIIGYDVIIDYLENKITFSKMRDLIFFATKQYAKRQRTFWRGLKKKIEEFVSSDVHALGQVYELDLTLSDHTLYINQLIDRFKTWKYNE